MDLPAVIADDYYRSLRRRLRAWLQDKGKAYAYADALFVAPDLLHLLCRLTLDARVPRSEKVQLASAIAYFVSVIDFVPEGLLGPIGLIDDVALAALALQRLIGAGHAKLAQEYWAGDGDLLQLLQRVLALAEKAIGSGVWQRVRSLSKPGR
jgi:uncharacterized membrane protein YkvA (DUF1232 family)